MFQFAILILVALCICLSIYIFTRQYYLNRLEEIKRMCFSLTQSNASSRLLVGKKSTNDIALILNDASRQFTSQLNQLQNDKNKLEAILSSMTEGVIVIRATGTLQHVSPNIRQMLDLRSNDWMDRPYWEIIRHQDINEAIKEALIGKKALKREIADLSISKAFFSMQISPVINDNNELFAVVAVLHDITELKQLEHMRAEFVANVSHELKTPLTSIKGYVETLKDAIHDDPKSVANFLNIIMKQTQRLEELVHDLLILSSLESSSVKFDFHQQAIKPVMLSVLQTHQQSIMLNKHELIVNIPDNLPLIKFDRLRIEQVFINLIDNAVKFTQPGGKISILAIIEKGFLKITVQDSGVGIPREHLSRIFERFYRVDKARSRDTGGTGLGLSIVHQIIQAHQGQVVVESTLGIGTTFNIFLPLNR